MPAALIGEPGIYVFNDIQSLSGSAAELVSRLSIEADRKYGLCTIGLSGGSTPCRLYRNLAKSAFRIRMPWSRIHLFWGDERCVPPDHPDSNYHLVKETLLNGAPVPEVNIHRVRAEESQETAADQYEQEMRDFFEPSPGRFPHLDIQLLGMGDDGHTASLFPNGLELYEKDRIVIGTQKPGGWRRISTTIPVLNASRNVVWMVTGEAKADMLQRALGPADMGVPASMVKPEGNSYWLVDAAAAARLDPQTYKRQ
jgi:6-phosphogluconolactonase